MSVIGLLTDDTSASVQVMKVDKAPLESYADVGGLEDQIQEVKEAVELPMTHPELYEDIGIKPPKGVIFFGASIAHERALLLISSCVQIQIYHTFKQLSPPSKVPLAPARRCSRRRWRMRPVPPSCASWARS